LAAARAPARLVRVADLMVARRGRARRDRDRARRRRPEAPDVSFERPWLLLLAFLPLVAFARGPRSLSRALQLIGAVALAVAVAAAPKGGRVIVLSDGVATDAADAGTAIAAARLRDVEIDGVPLVDPTRSDTAVTRAATPSAVHAGDTVPLLLTIHASGAGRATLSVARDGGRANSEQIIVHRGDNVLTLAYVARTRGWHSFRVAVRATGHTVPQNDLLAATVDVGAPPTALVAAPDGNSVVAQELAASGVSVATGPLPARPAAYQGYDLVVLDDVRR